MCPMTTGRIHKNWQQMGEREAAEVKAGWGKWGALPGERPQGSGWGRWGSHTWRPAAGQRVGQQVGGPPWRAAAGQWLGQVGGPYLETCCRAAAGAAQAGPAVHTKALGRRGSQGARSLSEPPLRQ